MLGIHQTIFRFFKEAKSFSFSTLYFYVIACKMIVFVFFIF